jgi:hypothetical protein
MKGRPRPPLARTAAAGLAMLAASDHAPAAQSAPPGPPPALSRQSDQPRQSVATAGATADATKHTIETTPAPASPEAPTDASSAWPKDFQVTVNLIIGGSATPPKSYRPYAAFWIENADHELIRTLCVLGNDSRFNNHLTTWKRAGGYFVYASPVTRATRPQGLYSVVWDGRDDYNAPVPKGTYTVWVELVREEGRHTQTSATIVCDNEPHSVDLAATVESGASKIEYGPKPVAPPASIAAQKTAAPAVPPAFPARP